MFYSSCFFLLALVNFITLAVWRREEQVSSIRLDFIICPFETFPFNNSFHFQRGKGKGSEKIIVERAKKSKETNTHSVICFSDISKEMAIDSYDIVSTLQALGMMKYWKGKHIILKKQVSAPLCCNPLS